MSPDEKEAVASTSFGYIFARQKISSFCNCSSPTIFPKQEGTMQFQHRLVHSSMLQNLEVMTDGKSKIGIFNIGEAEVVGPSTKDSRDVEHLCNVITPIVLGSFMFWLYRGIV